MRNKYNKKTNFLNKKNKLLVDFNKKMNYNMNYVNGFIHLQGVISKLSKG